MMITPFDDSKPSISTNSAFSVCSRSSWLAHGLAPRALPNASISSMNTIHGAFACACANKSRTRAAPTPTNISTKSEPEIEKNGTFASPATAFASRVLPVPGGPTNITPFGMCAPNARNFAGCFKKSTTSRNSSTASSIPATSLKFVLVVLSTYTFARDFPNDISPPVPPPPIRRIRKLQSRMIIPSGSTQAKKKPFNQSESNLPSKSIFFSSSCLTRSGSSTRTTSNGFTI